MNFIHESHLTLVQRSSGRIQIDHYSELGIYKGKLIHNIFPLLFFFK